MQSNKRKPKIYIIMRVRDFDEVKLKVTMPDGFIIIDSGPLDLVCDNFNAGCPANWDTDDARLEILDKLNEGTPGCQAEFITDNNLWKSLVKRIEDSDPGITWR